MEMNGEMCLGYRFEPVRNTSKINKYSLIIVLQIFQLFLNLTVPTNIMVFIFLFSEITIIYLLRKKILNLLLIATFFYNLFFIIPYIVNFYYPLEDLAPYSVFLMVPDYYDKSIFYFIIFKTTFNIAFFIFNNTKLKQQIVKKRYLSMKVPYVFKLIIYFVAILSFLLQIFVGIGFDNFLQTIKYGDRFLINNPLILNSSYAILFLIFVYFYLLYREKKVKIYEVIFIFILFEIYPFSNSSRAIALPFFVAAFIDFVYDYKKQALTKIVFSAVSYFFALSFRGRSSGEFQLLEFMKNMDLIFMYTLMNTSNLPTLSKTLEAISDKVIDISYSPFRFLYYFLYILPIPSTWLGDNVGKLTSLTPHFDFPLGITLDIVSESSVWFGPIGPLFFGFFWGSIAGFINKKFYSQKDLFSLVLFMTFVYFIAATNTYPTRHSSRLFVYSYTIIFLWKFIAKFSKTRLRSLKSVS